MNNNFAFRMYFVLSFRNYRDRSLYGDAQAICRLHTVSILTFLWPSSFFFNLFIVESDDYIYTRSSLIANEIRTQRWSVLIFFTSQTKILIGIINNCCPCVRITWRRSSSTGIIVLGRSHDDLFTLRPRTILPVEGEQSVMLPSHKGNNCIIFIYIYIAILKDFKNVSPTILEPDRLRLFIY